ncbi:septation protein SepH [Arcanobacterium ihumii]|uniref:septation protein SepH n=1 Tax=Arcanobacterium ihumii TaxID=2138162 RepID=UPI000F5471C0|nr:septation protein SepH [Arcanobacterium ihumii]
MIELELLGLDADGARLSLNDAEGNRYTLPISDDLRAALRHDVSVPAQEELKPLTPREIQAFFRAGKTISDVSELSSVPPSQLASLEHPIKVERRYNAELAKGFRISQDSGGMTLEELVISRLVERGLSPQAISWDAIREAGEPWTLLASYTIGSQDFEPRWKINSKSQTVIALNDEAAWLTETQIHTPNSPWRPLNTPKVSVPAAGEPPRENSLGHLDNANEKSSKEPESHDDSSSISSVSALPSVNIAFEQDDPSSSKAIDIDDVLASLDSQRGVSRPMPIDSDIDDVDFAGAHPADSEPHLAQDATVLRLPDRNRAEAENELILPVDVDDFPQSSSATLPGFNEIESDSSQQETPDSDDSSPKKKSRRDRPAMPSWDEIVFGYSKDDDR